MKEPVTRARPKTVLLVEAVPSLQLVYRTVLLGSGHEVRVANSAAEAWQKFLQSDALVVLLDVALPDRDGIDLMQDMLRLRPATRVIVIAADGAVPRVVAAMRAGAHEFLVKPFDEARFLAAVGSALEQPAAKRLPVPDAVQAEPSGQFIGTSESMQRIHAKIASVANSMATVFITGESGTGKELCALAVHASSNRAKGPFIALNCGAIPHDLLESEVFGHVKGSFTGAIADKPGAATAADGGTLFLDEICEMAPALQTKLLRFLQTSTVVPVGATKPQKVNVRIICATNRDPMEAVRQGQFREDLYYRLFVVPIHMPPLRERRDDVIEIAEAALQRFAAEEGRRFAGLSGEVADLFRSLPWPGNVRQVLNVIRNVVVLNPGGEVRLDMLPDLTGEPAVVAPPEPPRPRALADPVLDGLLGRSLAEIERIVALATLDQQGGSVPKAARVLDLSPSTLYRKLEAWGKGNALR